MSHADDVWAENLRDALNEPPASWREQQIDRLVDEGYDEDMATRLVDSMEPPAPLGERTPLTVSDGVLPDHTEAALSEVDEMFAEAAALARHQDTT